MECVIVYESPLRELQNAYTLKAELERRGHSVYICRLGKIMGESLDFRPDVVIFPYLYGTYIVDVFLKMFKNKIPRVVNMQYEQVLNKKREEIGTHNPTGKALKAIHLCWGMDTRERLIKANVPEKNLPVVGCINVDMDLERFEKIYISKEEMAKKYNLNENKKWILFISSFTDNTDEALFGEENTRIFNNILRKSKEEILNWIEKYIKDNDVEFIYRPHPSESENYSVLLRLSKKYNNFHIIKSDSVRSWIKVSDKINTWLSTSIIDAYFMKKDCCILRPVEINKDFDIIIMKDAEYITTYENFYKYNNSNNLDYKFPIEKQVIEKYYDVNPNKYSYERICDYLEYMVVNNITTNLYD